MTMTRMGGECIFGGSFWFYFIEWGTVVLAFVLPMLQEREGEEKECVQASTSILLIHDLVCPPLHGARKWLRSCVCRIS